MIRWIRSTVRTAADTAAAEPEDGLRAQWDRLRDAATTPSERAEIDAVFSRHAA